MRGNSGDSTQSHPDHWQRGADDASFSLSKSVSTVQRSENGPLVVAKEPAIRLKRFAPADVEKCVNVSICDAGEYRSFPNVWTMDPVQYYG